MTDTTLDRLIQEQADAIANQAAAIAAGTLTGPRRAAVLLLIANAQTMLAWIDKEDTTP